MSSISVRDDSSSIGRNRYAWVDVAKGICILAVVCLYAKTYIGYAHADSGWLDPWTKFAKPFRMPDFFLLSGLFLSRVIDRPWRGYLDTKVVHYLFFLTLWTAPYLAWRLFDETPVDLTFFKAIKLYIYFLIQPMAMLWFIQILAAYFLVTRLLRRVPGYLLLLSAAVLMALRVRTGFSPVDNFGEYYVFFLAGYLFASRIFSWADWAASHRLLAAILVVVWAFANAWVVSEGWSLLPVWDMLIGFVGIGAIIALSSFLADRPWMRWVQYLGQNSIIVYLGFYLPLQWWLAMYSHFGWQLNGHVLATTTVILSVLAALLMGRLTQRGVLFFLFERPAWAHLRRPVDRPGSQVPV